MLGLDFKLSPCIFFLLGDSSAYEIYMPTLRNTLFHLHRWCELHMKIKLCSETSARKTQTPGNHPKERIQKDSFLHIPKELICIIHLSLCHVISFLTYLNPVVIWYSVFRYRAKPLYRSRYGMDGFEFESRWRRKFSHPSRSVLGSNQLFVPWVLCLIPEG